MEKWFTPVETTALPSVERVLVIAPHPDDEIFGCGGALALLAGKAVQVHVHILTNGAGYAPPAEGEAIFAVRRRESVGALGRLGADITGGFSGFPDRGLSHNSRVVSCISGLLDQYKPDLVLAPSPWEIHPDHAASARATWSAILQQQVRQDAWPIALLFYEIGSPLRANFLLDITSVWENKSSAMQCFASQLEQQDYARHIEGLNTFRTYTLPPAVRYAEAYYYVAAGELTKAALAASADLPATAQASGFDLPTLCMNRWIDAVLTSASVHAEDLQRSLIDQTRSAAELAGQYQQLQASFAASQAQLAGMRELAAQTKEEFNRLLSERDQVRIACEQMRQELGRVWGELAGAKSATLHAQAELSQTRDQLVWEQLRIHGLYASTSWRLTAPLRWLARMLRRQQS